MQIKNTSVKLWYVFAYLCIVCICVFVYLCIFLQMEAVVQVAAQVISTGDGPGLKEPIDCADSNDCFCNEMILTSEIDHLKSCG